MYEYADKVIRYLNARYVEIFNKLKRNVRSLAKMDEITTLGYVTETYTKLNEITTPLLVEVAKRAYKAANHDDIIDELWALDFLNSFNPTSTYIYTKEAERKKYRSYEAIMSKDGKVDAFDKAKKYWAQMVAEYAIEITDAATLQAYKDKGVKKVVWMTEEDNRVCHVCEERQDKVYDIDKVPPKPHWGCRCYYLPYTGKTK